MEEDLLVAHVNAVKAAVPDAGLSYEEVIAILQALCTLDAAGQPIITAACALINAQPSKPQRGVE
jgi:hypothetical protein